MDEKVIQQAKAISHEIVKNEFPDEEEYYDFLFDLTIQEIQELEPGKETELLREIRAIHPELILGYTPIIIILTVQILRGFTLDMTETTIRDKIAHVVKDKNEQEKLAPIFKYLMEYFEKKNE